MRDAGIAIALALACALPPRADEPGWVRQRGCAAGPRAAGDSAAVAGLPWIAPDTLKPPGGLGSPLRFKLYRDGQPLLAGQDFRVPAGDSLIVLAAPAGPGDSVCWERAYSPLLPPIPPRYRLEAIPIYRGGSADTSARIAARGPAGADTAYGKYRLDFTGSKSMAVTVGSGGGLGLDASLFLNLNGQVAGDVFVEGQLSDQNVPIQPEGNTATLKEVDTKYVRVYGSRYSYTLGDYLLDYGVPGEDRFTAKVQGVDGRYGRGGYALRGSWSMSRGQYQSDTLRGVDGKQRGYYLRGRDGRTFITVLAGTERVWRNGAPLRRGTDYTIDYSEGRLDFLPPMVVTGENLFAAEFQYTEQDFPRSLAAGELRDSAGAFTWSVRAIDENDDGDNPYSLAPDTAQARQFREQGDSTRYDSLGRPVAMPHRQSAAAADVGLRLPGYDGRAALLLSRLDRNLYSPRDDGDNLGYSTRYLGAHALGRPIDRGGRGRFELALDHEARSRDYESFKQLIEPRGFLETWNLDARVGRKGFQADRISLKAQPYSALSLGGELGRAEADSAGDAASPRASRGSLSRRGGLSARLGGGRLYLEAGSEAKLARSPDRRDNYKQTAAAGLEAAGLAPSFRLARNEWIAGLPSGRTARSVKQEPEFLLSTATPLAGRVSLSTGVSALSQRSDFDGRLEALRDSVLDWGFQEKAMLLGWGPWTSDLFYSYRDHRAWRIDPAGAWADAPEENVYHQLEWNSRLAEGRKGYGLTSSYRVSQTAEYPLVEDYRELKGRGDYIKEGNEYHKVESGGDWVLVGMMRDTTVGSRPYQDLSFAANLNLAPGRFPFPVTGVLADLEFTLDLAFDAQDTTSDPALLPLFSDAQLDRARSGRSRYAPALHWRAPGGGKAANLDVDRTYGRAAGIYAYRERLWSQRADYRAEAGADWEWVLEQAYGKRDRFSGAAATGSRTRTRNQLYGARLSRKLPKAFQAEARSQYLRIDGSGANGTIGLQGAKPALKLEKSSLFNGRAFAEYGLIYYWGRGDGGYYATGDYAKGLTHRFEANANFQAGPNLFLNFDYVLRLEPRGGSPVQKMTAEARAVF